MASGIQKWHNSHAPNSPETSGGGSFSSFLFADGGILIEPNLGTRCTESALCWGKGCRLTFGMDSANKDKLEEEEEGNWDSQALVPCYLLNTNNWTISTPWGRIRGSQSLTHSPYLGPGNRSLPLEIIQ